MKKFLAKTLASTFLLMGSGSADTVSIPERLMVDLQADLHLTPLQAAAVTGNLAHETLNFQIMQEMSPLVKGSRGGFGYSQWTGPRRRAYEAFGEGQDLSRYDVNYAFLIEELRGPYARVLKRLKGMTDLRRATNYFMKHFLGPDPNHANLRSRLHYATNFLGGDFSGSGCESMHITYMKGRHEMITTCEDLPPPPDPSGMGATFAIAGPPSGPQGEKVDLRIYRDPWHRLELDDPFQRAPRADPKEDHEVPQI